jgi:hypothetical protein
VRKVLLPGTCEVKPAAAQPLTAGKLCSRQIEHGSAADGFRGMGLQHETGAEGGTRTHTSLRSSAFEFGGSVRLHPQGATPCAADTDAVPFRPLSASAWRGLGCQIGLSESAAIPTHRSSLLAQEAGSSRASRRLRASANRRRLLPDCRGRVHPSRSLGCISSRRISAFSPAAFRDDRVQH